MKTIEQRPRNAVISIVAAVLILGAVFLYAGRAVVYADLVGLNLVPAPEHFTELYFQNPASLPKQTIANQPISFSFVIHNLEGATTTYPYLIFFQSPFGNPVIFATGTISLADGAWETISDSYTFPESNLQGTVVVELTSLGQQIDFLLPNNN